MTSQTIDTIHEVHTYYIDNYYIKETIFGLFFDRSYFSVTNAIQDIQNKRYTFSTPYEFTIIFSKRCKKYFIVTEHKSYIDMIIESITLFQYNNHTNWVPTIIKDDIVYYNPFYNSDEFVHMTKLKNMFSSVRIDSYLSKDYCIIVREYNPPRANKNEYTFIEKHKKIDYFVFIEKDEINLFITPFLHN